MAVVVVEEVATVVAAVGFVEIEPCAEVDVPFQKVFERTGFAVAVGVGEGLNVFGFVRLAVRIPWVVDWATCDLVVAAFVERCAVAAVVGAHFALVVAVEAEPV